MLSSRKADREGHSADAVADALFKIVFAIRFRRQGESQILSVRKLLSVLMDGRGEEVMGGCIVTADIGYGEEVFMNLQSEFGVGSVFVMPDHLLRVHLFVAASCLDPRRCDSDEDDEAAQVVSADGVASLNDEPHEGLLTVLHDRRRSFIINDAPTLGPEAFFAKKSAPLSDGRTAQRRIIAIVGREHDTKKCSKVLRLMYCVPESVQTTLSTWVAAPKESYNFSNALFCKKPTDQTEASHLKAVMKNCIRSTCNVLTVGQRCADWFV